LFRPRLRRPDSPPRSPGQPLLDRKARNRY
jgi:hypothetical protein